MQGKSHGSSKQAGILSYLARNSSYTDFHYILDEAGTEKKRIIAIFPDVFSLPFFFFLINVSKNVLKNAWGIKK